MGSINHTLLQLTNQLSNHIETYENAMLGGKGKGKGKGKSKTPKLHEDLQQYQQLAGNVKVYTGPKQGKFIINKNGKKVYIDRKGLKTDIPYNKKVVKRKAK